MKTVEFEGVISGDGECFCFDVDVENYKKVVGEEPDDYAYPFTLDADNNLIRLSNLARLYPSNIFGYGNGKKLRVKVSIEEIN